MENVKYVTFVCILTYKIKPLAGLACLKYFQMRIRVKLTLTKRSSDSLYMILIYYFNDLVNILRRYRIMKWLQYFPQTRIINASPFFEQF